MKLFQFLGLVAGIAFVGAFVGIVPVQAQEVGGGVGAKENLDLPYDAALLGEEGNEEDAPEIIEFYGQQYEGDGVFYVIDRSGSMRNSGELGIAKREVLKNVAEFSDRVQFAIVFFDIGLMPWPTSGRPADASPAMKASATSWVNSVQGGGGSCCGAGLMKGLQYANLSSAKRKVLVYVGDGGGTCQGANEGQYLKQTLAQVKTANFQRVQINCIGVLEVGQMQEQFLRSLAAANSGRYTKIGR